MRHRHAVLYFVCPDTFNLYLSPPSSPSPYTHAHWKSIKCLLSDFLVEDVPWRHPQRLSTSGWLQRPRRRHSSSSRCVIVWTSRCFSWLREVWECVHSLWTECSDLYWTWDCHRRCSAETLWQQRRSALTAIPKEALKTKNKKTKRLRTRVQTSLVDSQFGYTHITVNWHSSTGRKNPN